MLMAELANFLKRSLSVFNLLLPLRQGLLTQRRCATVRVWKITNFQDQDFTAKFIEVSL